MEAVSGVLEWVGNSYFGNMFQRNRRRIATGVVITSSTYLAARMLRYYLSRYPERNSPGAIGYGSTDNGSLNKMNRLRMHSYWESTQKNATDTVLKFCPSLREKLFDLVEMESGEQLRKLRGSKEEKIAVWNQLKEKAFTRLICGVYSICLLVLFLRVEVNILGRYLYLDSSIPNDTPEEQPPITADVQSKYLAFALYLSTGLKDLVAEVSKKVEQEMKSWPLEKNYNFMDLCGLVQNIRFRVEGVPKMEEVAGEGGNQECVWHKFLLPSEKEQQPTEDKQLHSLVNETRDVLESVHFEKVLKKCLNKAFSLTLDSLRTSFESSPTNGLLPMPKIIPLIKKQSNTVLDTNVDGTNQRNEIVQALSNMKEVSEYSYYIFSSSYDEL